MRWLLSLSCAAVMALAAVAAPPKIPGKVIAAPGGRVVIEIEAPAKDVTVAWKSAFSEENCFVDELKPLRPDTVRLIVLPSKPGIYRVVVWSGLTAADSDVVVIDATDGKPVPPPTPVPPTPTPPDVVTSFRVIFVYESETTLTIEQKAVIYAKSVSDYLNSKATKEQGLAGWRRYDKDTTATNEQPTMKALWGAVKPKLTTVPCVAVEVNEKVQIIPLAATPDEMVATLKKYAGDK